MPVAGIHNSAAQPIAAAVPRWNCLILCISWAPLSLFRFSIGPRRRNAYERGYGRTLPRIRLAIHRLCAVGRVLFNPPFRTADGGLRFASPPYPSPFLNQRLAVELAARALGQGFAQEDLLWRLEGRKLRCAIAQEIVRHEHFTRTQHHVAYHFLTPHGIRNADGRGLGDFVALQQDAVDLHRRNVDAAADDEVLRAAGEMQEAVGVEIADVAGAHPAATVRPRGSVVAEIAILVVVPGADLDLADFTGWKFATFRIHDRQPLVCERPADGAKAPLAPGVDRNPGGLAAAVALRHRNAETRLE